MRYSMISSQEPDWRCDGYFWRCTPTFATKKRLISSLLRFYWLENTCKPYTEAYSYTYAQHFFAFAIGTIVCPLS